MQAIAVWLVARPLNAVLALALTASLGPGLSLVSNIVLVTVLLRFGPRVAAGILALALVVTGLAGLLVGVPLATALPGAVIIWMPAFLLSVVLMMTRSLTLTIQLSVIVATGLIAGIFLFTGSPVEFWNALLTELAQMLREAGQIELAGYMEQLKENAEELTRAAVLTMWSAHISVFVLGYRFFRLLPDQEAVFGRFRDLNLGKVIALVLAIMSVLSMVTDMEWLLNAAFVMFGVFWIQGLAIVHWLYGEQMLPRAGLVTAYVLLLSVVLTAIAMMGLAIFGYLDAWFRLRRQPKIK